MIMTLESFLALAKQGHRVLVSQEFSAPDLLPITVFQGLQARYPETVILESLTQGNSRYSFIAFAPFASLEAKRGVTTIRMDQALTAQKIAPLTALRQMMRQLSCVAPQDKDFSGSIIGFMSYGAVRLFEKIPDRHESNDLADILVNFYRCSLRFDQATQKVCVSVLVEVGADPEQRYHETCREIDGLMVLLQSMPAMPMTFAESSLEINSPQVDMDDQAFKAMIEKAKAYIKAGDVFQVVLSRTFRVPCRVDPLTIYQALRLSSPAPYMFYLPVGDRVIMGASPEKLISVQAGEIKVNPIAGTRRRSNQHQDQAIEQDLLSDEKERAEHMMLVDLARNDVGKVAEIGSVKVTELLKVKHYAHVSHITSEVSGHLRAGYDALDALVSAFPAGTLTGAPKIRAMEIIDELEASSRGLYGGTIFRMDYQGNLDSCIAIRMMCLQQEVALIRAGAGLVFDSDPEAEADETRHKARAMLYALALAEEGSP